MLTVEYVYKKPQSFDLSKLLAQETFSLVAQDVKEDQRDSGEGLEDCVIITKEGCTLSRDDINKCIS